MLIKLLPLMVGIVPTLAVTLAYWLGVEAGQLPSCIPYIDGCTSISSTGRHPPGSFVFRAVELPLATALVVVWYFVVQWLRALRPAEPTRTGRWIMSAGVAAALALIVYATLLGTREPLYEFMRRFGIYVYFIGTVVAQLTTSMSMQRLAHSAHIPALIPLARSMLVLVLLPFVLGLLNFVLKAVLDDADRTENRIEWIVTLALQAWFVLLYFAWRTTGFRVSVGTGSDGPAPPRRAAP